MPRQFNSNSSDSFCFWNVVQTLCGWVQDWISGGHSEYDNNDNRRNIDGKDGNDGGGNTNIDLGGGFNLHLSGVNTANLHGDDFLF